jgi:Flp pilus assembly protein TadD
VFREYDPDPRLLQIAELIDDDRCEEALGRLEDLEPALADPETLGASIGLRLVCLLFEEREEDAEELFERLFSDLAADADAVRAAGIECSEFGEYEMAERIFRRAYGVEPDAGTAFNLAVALQGDDRHEEALTWLDTAAQQGADFPSLHRTRAYSLDQLERLQEATQSWKAYLQLEPGDSDGWTHLAIDESDLEDSENALQDFRRAIELDPGNAMAWYNCAITATRIGDRDRLAECVASLHDLEPASWRSLITAMRLAELDGDIPRAWELGCDAVDTAIRDTREEDAATSLPHVLQTVIGMTEGCGLNNERARLLDRAFDLGLFYEPVFDALRADKGRLSSQAALYEVLVDGRITDPDLLAELREEDEAPDGQYRYLVAFRSWAENMEDAEAKVLEFEKSYGPGAELQIHDSKPIAEPIETKCGIAWRGHMHVFLEHEE